MYVPFFSWVMAVGEPCSSRSSSRVAPPWHRGSGTKPPRNERRHLDVATLDNDEVSEKLRFLKHPRLIPGKLPHSETW